MARHEAGSCEACHTNCAPCGPRAFTWQVCQPASQTNHSLAVNQKLGCTDGNVLFCALTYIRYVDINLHHRRTNHSLAVNQKLGCTDGNVLFCALTYIRYVDIILLNLNKREKSEAK